MEFKADLTHYRDQVNAELSLFLEEEIQVARKISHFTQTMAEHITEFTQRGGKRIRPLLAIKAYQLLGGKKEKEMIRASLSVELLQSYLLIHDDLMDQDALRRGKPSTWKFFTEFHKKNFHTPHSALFGSNMAILAGDICESFSHKAIIQSGFDPILQQKALTQLTQMNLFTGYGQMLDVVYEQMEKITLADVLKMFELKTAHYTLSGPLKLGAIFAEANPAISQTLSDYGIPAGKAFQIHDDILGLFADETKLGKPLGSDLSEGKRTILMAYVFAAGESKEKTRVLALLGKKSISSAELATARDDLKSMGVLAQAELQRQQFVDKALQITHSDVLVPEMQDFLSQFTHYLVSREY